MSRAILIVLDSVGCGGAPDAADFGDEGANTLGHIIAECAAGRADEGRSGPLHVPNMDALGLGAAIRLSSDMDTPGLAATTSKGAWGAATEVSIGKDTPSGHWELAGLPVPWEWHYFPKGDTSFPDDLVAQIIAKADIPGILGNCHSPGIAIIDRLGAQSVESGMPICYTSVDSVFQIAAHEDAFGLDRLYRLCETCAEILHPMRVGRVIARPFIGNAESGFQRTANRRDLAITPPQPTLCNWVEAAGGRTLAVGKIKDIFSGSGITEGRKGASDDHHIDLTLDWMDSARDGDLIFSNLVDFDTLYGHPRDVAGYARNLEAFDKRLPQIIGKLSKDDLLILTADHGNDPTWQGSDHTRERVPVLACGPNIAPREIGICGFTDVAASIAKHLGLPQGPHGRPFL
jgi:phosphopentomutase